MTEQRTHRRARNDFLLIAAIALAAAVGALYLFVFRPAGNTVTVTIDGTVYKTFSLSQTVDEWIPSGEKGEHYNRLVIRDGKAVMESASCPDGICVSHAPIYRDGESIVCLPNRVVVTITTSHSDAPDVVV